MYIAYMILAHHQPLLLQRLVDRLDQPNVKFYIHIDKKTKNLESFRAALSSFSNVTIISTCDVNWMGYTTIDAELDLMKEAYNSGIQFKYYVLMSGNDYPIKSNAYINDFFNSHSTDFISYTNMNFISEEMKNKVKQYHFRDIPFINPRNPKKIPFLVYLYFGSHRYLMKLLPERKFYNNMEPYFGSQWFALTHATIEYILRFVNDNPGYVRAMKNTDGPDEVFFHTIVMNSVRKTNVYDYDKYLEWLKVRKGTEVFTAGLSSLRYMDWSDRPGKSKPAVLEETYFDTLAASKELFGRKFDEKESAQLLNKIDSQFLNKNDHWVTGGKAR